MAATLSEATDDLTKAAGSADALAIMRTEAARRGCDAGTRALTANEEAEATERSNTRDIIAKCSTKLSEWELSWTFPLHSERARRPLLRPLRPRLPPLN